MDKTIGFVGTGTMGSRMIERLLMKGHKVTVYNRNKNATKPLVEKGAEPVDKMQNLVKSADFICISVPDDSAIKDVVTKAVSNDCADKVFISLSTISPDMAMELSEMITDKKSLLFRCSGFWKCSPSRSGSINYFCWRK